MATHAITAVYGGDSTFISSTSTNSIDQTVNQISTTTSVTSSTSATVFGQSVTFTATVTATGFDNGGTVTFEDGGTSIGTAGVNSGGKATFSTTGLSAVTLTHTINAVYGGDTNFSGSAGSVLQTVNKAGTSTTVSQSSETTTYGQLVTFTATVNFSDGTPTGMVTGTVTFYTGSPSKVLGTGTLASHDGVATATFTTSSWAASSDHYNYNGAVYGGDSNFNGSGDPTDGPWHQVNKASSTTSLAASADPSVFGRPVTFTAVVYPQWGGTATGTVTFSDGSTSLGTASVSGNSAIFTAPSTVISEIGTHTITAVYSGDTNVTGSTSATLTQIVIAPSLYVTDFTPAATGFTAIFNRALNVGTVSSPVLNLYDNSSGLLGPVDVTLVRASNGASISGSLVINSTSTQITFAQTGQSGVLPSSAPNTLFGVLPNDTYTVTLRSATNGFKDAAGDLLDGIAFTGNTHGNTTVDDIAGGTAGLFVARRSSVLAFLTMTPSRPSARPVSPYRSLPRAPGT